MKNNFFPSFSFNLRNPLELIVGGLTFYTLSYRLFISYIPEMLSKCFMLLGIIMTFIGLLRIKKRTNVSNDIKGIAILMIIYGLVYLLFAFIEGFKTGLIINPQYALFLFLPFFLFVKFEKEDLEIVYKYLFWALFLTTLHLVFNANRFIFHTQSLMSSFHDSLSHDYFFYLNQVTVGTVFAVPFVIFLIPKHFIPQKQKIFAIFSTILALVISLSWGRRSGSVRLLAVLLMPFFINILKNKRMAIVLIFVLILFSMFFDDILSLFPVLNDRLDADTRSDEDLGVITSMRSLTEWLFGRGLNATYNSVWDAHRTGIETGYLNIIMHLGIIYLCLYAYLLIKSFFRGFYFSNNFFVKGSAIYCLMCLLWLYPGGQPSWGINDFLLYLCIIVCNSNFNFQNEDIDKLRIGYKCSQH